MLSARRDNHSSAFAREPPKGEVGEDGIEAKVANHSLTC